MTQVTVADVCLLRSCHATTLSTVVTSNDPADRISRIDSEPSIHATRNREGHPDRGRSSQPTPAREESAGAQGDFYAAGETFTEIVVSVRAAVHPVQKGDSRDGCSIYPRVVNHLAEWLISERTSASTQSVSNATSIVPICAAVAASTRTATRSTRSTSSTPQK